MKKKEREKFWGVEGKVKKSTMGEGEKKALTNKVGKGEKGEQRKRNDKQRKQ